jgi:hypothetical protein
MVSAEYLAEFPCPLAKSLDGMAPAKVYGACESVSSYQWRPCGVRECSVCFSGRTEAPYVVPETPMPPNTILLSQMMRELSATPGFTDAQAGAAGWRGKKGPGCDAQAHRAAAGLIR